MCDSDSHKEMLSIAKQLVAELEAGNNGQATSLVDELAHIREGELFQEIGKLTRELHSSITSFEIDSELCDITESDIPDAKERLNYVITMTNQSANRTLTAVENAIPYCDALHDKSVQLGAEWKRFVNREMNADEFRKVSKTLEGYLAKSEEQLDAVKGALNEILMAQEFQDLTSQIINRVIKMVEDVESHLVNMIKATGSAPVAAKEEEKGKLEGPQVPGLSKSETVNGQDEVDDLLSSLGF